MIQIFAADIDLTRHAYSFHQEMLDSPIDIVRYDIGGRIAQLIAVNYSEKIRKLVLMDSICFDSRPIPEFEPLQKLNRRHIKANFTDIIAIFIRTLLKSKVDKSNTKLLLNVSAETKPRSLILFYKYLMVGMITIPVNQESFADFKASSNSSVVNT